MLRRIDRIAQHVVCAVEPQLESYPCAKAATAVEPLEAERAIPPFVTEAPSLPLSPDVRSLTDAEINQFHADGYVLGLPLFAEGAVPRLQAKALEMFAQLEDTVPGARVDSVNMWQKANRFCYELSRTPAILDYVQGILGPDFFQWGCHFFKKDPQDGSVIPWQ